MVFKVYTIRESSDLDDFLHELGMLVLTRRERGVVDLLEVGATEWTDPGPPQQCIRVMPYEGPTLHESLVTGGRLHVDTVGALRLAPYLLYALPVLADMCRIEERLGCSFIRGASRAGVEAVLWDVKPDNICIHDEDLGGGIRRMRAKFIDAEGIM